MMTLTELVRELGLTPAAASALESHWRPEPAWETLPEFLTPEFAARWYPLLNCPVDFTEAFARVRAAARAEALRLYAHLMRAGAFLDRPPLNPLDAELPPAVLGADGGAFHLLLAMACLPVLAVRNRRRGWPEECVEGVARWIGGTVPIYRAAHGVPGHCITQTHWLRRSIDGELFRLGRLEFEPQPAPNWLPAVFRRRTDGRVVALCRDGWSLGKDGFRLPDGDPQGTCAALEYGEGTVRGIPVDTARGTADPERRAVLSLDEYESCFAAYETLAGVHIPGGERLDMAAARASLDAARFFFRRHLRRELAGYCCRSWILNPDWQRELPDSNLARFQRRVHLFPLPPDPRCGEFFIFGRRGPVDYATAPADNPMQRAFHRLHAAGRPLREGGMFLLPGETFAE